jgi:Ca2+-binding EF-hand superfamily protein
VHHLPRLVFNPSAILLKAANRLVSAYVNFPLLRSHRETFEKLELRRQDVGALYRQFREIDADGSSTIDIVEMLVALQLERTKFTKRIFSILIDKNRSGHLFFVNFVLGIWNFCTLQKTSFGKSV